MAIERTFSIIKPDAVAKNVIGEIFATASDLISMAEQERNDATDYHQFTSLINKNFTAQQKVKIVECLWQVAFADGALHEHEEHLVRKIAELIYVPHRAFINAKHRVLDG